MTAVASALSGPSLAGEGRKASPLASDSSSSEGSDSEEDDKKADAVLAAANASETAELKR